MRIYTTWHRWSITIDISVLFLWLFMYKPVNCDLFELNKQKEKVLSMPKVAYLGLFLMVAGGKAGKISSNKSKFTGTYLFDSKSSNSS